MDNEMSKDEKQELMAKVDALRHERELEKVRTAEKLKAENARLLEEQKAEQEKWKIIKDAELKRELELEKIRVKAEEDRALETLKHENAMTLEKQKASDQKKIEWHKAGGLIVKVIVGGLVFFGLKSFCDTHDLSTKNIPNDIMK